MHDIEVSVHIDASPGQVWSLIADPTEMERFSPEVHKVTWVGGVGAPAVGAKFRGANRRGWHRWSTSCEVVTYEPAREIAWDVSFVLPISRWGYRIDADPDGKGCTLTECWDDRRPAPMRSGPVSVLVGNVSRGVSDTQAHNRAGMEATLDAIKSAAEAPSPAS